MNYHPTLNSHIPGLVNWYDTTNRKYFNLIKKDVDKLFENYVQPYKSSKHGRRRMSRFIQIGTSCIDADDGYFRYIPDNNPQFKNILSYIARIHVQYEKYVVKMTKSKVNKDNKQNLNVTIREYKPGQSIGFHTDRTYFDGMIWSVIIVCEDINDGICFQDPNTKVKYKIHELPGLITVQTGKSRYEFKHGVETVKSRRISITWRFFNNENIEKLSRYDKSLKRMPYFINELKKLTFNNLNKLEQPSLNSNTKSRDFNISFPEENDTVLMSDINQVVSTLSDNLYQFNSSETEKYSLFSFQNDKQLPILTPSDSFGKKVIKPPRVSNTIIGMISDFPNLTKHNNLYEQIGHSIKNHFKGNICFLLLKENEENDNFKNMIKFIKCDEVNIKIIYIYDYFDKMFLKSNAFIAFGIKLKEKIILDYIKEERQSDLLYIPALKSESFQLVNTYEFSDFNKFTPFEVNVLTKSDLTNNTHKEFICQIISNFICEYC